MKKPELENRIKELELELSKLKSSQEASKNSAPPKSEENVTKFLALANYVKIHIAYLNPDTLRYEFVNDLYEKSVGIPKEKIIGSHIKDVIGEANFRYASKYIDEVKSGRSVSYETTFELADGKQWLQVHYSPILNTNNELIGIALVSYDNTERKHAEYLQQQTSLNYETFFNTIDELLFVLDEQGNIIHTNSTVIEQLGYTREELAGKSVFMVHPPERHEEVGRIVSEMLSGSTKFCPVPIITKSGVQIPVETRVCHGFWNGKPVIFGVTKDISRIKLSEEKFSKLFHLNPSACGLSDLENMKYIEVNEAFNTLLGFDKNEVIGKTALELRILTYETRNTILEYQDSKGNVSNVQSELRAKNGDIKNVLLSSENIYVQDKKYRLTVVHDITEHRKSELALKESEKQLLQVIADKDKFFSIIAHDLRTPFNAFLGLSHIMTEEMESISLKELQEIAMLMSKSASNLYSLLDNLLNWTRMKQGLYSFDPQKIVLSDVCSDAVEVLLQNAKEKDIAINILMDKNIEVFADLNMFKTVIRNLVSNAIKFTNYRGTISIKAEGCDKNITVSVSDNGVGIKPDLLGKLFSMSDVKTTTGTANEKGTGLGLLLCKDFVEKQHGKIWVESEAGKGSVFKFSLPVIVEQALPISAG